MGNDNKISTRMPPLNVGFNNPSTNVGQIKGAATQSLFQTGSQNNEILGTVGSSIEKFKTTKDDRTLINEIKSALNKIEDGERKVPLIRDGRVNVGETSTMKKMFAAFFSEPFFVIKMSKAEHGAEAQKVTKEFIKTVQRFMKTHNESEIIDKFNDAQITPPTTSAGDLKVGVMTAQMMGSAFLHNNLIGGR
ncbi:MAG: hypothetical protein KBD37_04360 [Burkholderiales bacterium]|nr:hypothetical protein [Burkholderiales bacterium]